MPKITLQDRCQTVEAKSQITLTLQVISKTSYQTAQSPFIAPSWLRCHECDLVCERPINGS